MNNNPIWIIAGVCCVWPILTWIPVIVVVRYWGRAKLRSPFVIDRELPSIQRERRQPPKNDPIGFGK